MNKRNNNKKILMNKNLASPFTTNYQKSNNKKLLNKGKRGLEVKLKSKKRISKDKLRKK